MLTLTITLFAASFAVEGAAIWLLVGEARQAQRSLERWQEANPKNNDDGSFGQQLVLNQVMIGLLGAPSRRALAVVLVAIGLVAGTAGNFVSLAL